MVDNTLSIIVPIFNEKDTIRHILQSILAVEIPLKRQIILVDDGSTDGSSDYLRSLQDDDPSIIVIFHEVNLGKGAAIRSGLEQVAGDIVLIQDADLEYDPSVYPKLLSPILDNKADVVYGSRFVGSDAHRVMYFWHYSGNRFLTLLSNIFTNLNLTDMEVGYKLFRREVLENIEIKEKRFGFEPEITAKIARKKWSIFEVGIPYYGRTYEQGKKITWRDGIVAIYAIIRYNVFR
jgi:glycosyltransferase involved in cell wall biosynthesis